MQIAVTGGTGFVGRHLITALLRDGLDVKALTRSGPAGDHDGAEWVQGSLSEPDSLDALVSGVDAVVHLAGLTKALNRNQFFDANQHGVRAIRDAVLKESPKAHLIYVSTLTATRPEVSNYAASKAAGEAELTDHTDRLRWTIMRPPAVYGPGDTEFLKIVKAAKFGLAPSAAPRGSSYSMIHVADLVEAILAVIRTGGPEQQIVEPDDGADNGYTAEELMATLGKVLGKKLHAVRIPKFLLMAVGAVNQLFALVVRKPAMLTIGKAKELSCGDWLCHDQSLIRGTGWVPKVTLLEGLTEAVAWYRRSGYL